MALLQVGFLATYLSGPLISGFMCASAFHVLASQLSLLFGIKLPRVSGPGNFFIVSLMSAFVSPHITTPNRFCHFAEILQPIRAHQGDQRGFDRDLHRLHCAA